MAHIFRIFLAALLLCNSSCALDPIRANTPDPQLDVLVSDSRKFIKEWRSAPSSHSPAIKRVTEARYNQKLHIGIVASNFGVDSSSNVDFTIGIEVIDPNGAMVFTNDRFAVQKGQIASSARVLMSSSILDIEFGPRDPVGVYKINATMSDNITHKRAAVSTALTIQP